MWSGIATLVGKNKGHLRLNGCLALLLTWSLGEIPCGTTTREDDQIVSGIEVHQLNGKITQVVRGKANDATGQEINPHTPFLIASVSKVFVAVAMLTLVDGQKLSLDDPVKKFFPEAHSLWLTDHRGQPTIHQLLNHTSGIPDAYGEEPIEEALFRQKISFAELFAAIDQEQLAAPPGLAFDYSNTGYIILGEIIRRVTNLTYASYLQRTIFVPLAMQESQIGEPTLLPAALSYVIIGGKKHEYLHYFNIVEKHVDDTFTDGNIYSTAHDLLVWSEALFAGKLLSAKLQKMMFTDYGAGYGYGINIRKDKEEGQYLYDHEGEWLGYRALVRFQTKSRATSIKLENLTKEH